MALIAYTGLADNSLSFLQNQLKENADAFIEVKEEKVKEELARLAGTAHVYLIGEKAGNPIKLAQATYALDHQLSVIILNEPPAYLKIKQALLFTPFIGSNVQHISTELINSISTATQEAISLTIQRRQYLRLKAASPLVLHQQAPLHEDVKSEYLDKFLQEAPIGAVLISDKGLVVAINKFALKTLELTEKQLIGTPFVRLFEIIEQRKLQKLLESSFHDTTLIHTLERNTAQGRQVLNIRLSKINVRHSISYSLAIITDITDVVSAQQKVEQQVKELRVVNEQLERANGDLDAFVYTASHDLKAPIANIEGLIELIKRKVGSQDVQLQSLFSMVEVSIERFMETIKDLTEVALIQKRGADDQKVQDARQVIEEVQIMIREMITSSDAIIEVSCPDDCSINFSRSNFRSIVYNLLSNAIKYSSPKRRPHIRLSLSKLPNYNLFSVQDNGLGIPTDKQDKIFSMFKRLHSHVEGSGIGLFIVKRIVDATQSKLEVDSTVGVGTTFKVYLKDYSL